MMSLSLGHLSDDVWIVSKIKIWPSDIRTCIKESVYVFIDLKLYGRLLSCGKRLCMYKKAIWCWYIAMAYPSDFSFRI